MSKMSCDDLFYFDAKTYARTEVRAVNICLTETLLLP